MKGVVMTQTINYQQVYEEYIPHSLKESLALPTRFYELTADQRLYVEELTDAGSKSTLEAALDPEILAETSSLAAEMGTQLYRFANMLNDHLDTQDNTDLIPPDNGNSK